MDSHHIVHFPGMLSNSIVWHHELRFGGSLLLDPCDSRLESWHTYGAGHLAHCDIGFDNAAIGGCQDH